MTATTVEPPSPTFRIPRLRDICRRSVPHLVEATLVPSALYYIAVAWDGVFAAIVAALIWDYACIGLRIARGKRLPGLLILTTLVTTVRTVLALASHSAFLYFLEPCLSTGAVGVFFAYSMFGPRPLAARLAHDFIPLPREFCQRPEIRRLFAKLSGVWAAVYLVNAVAALALLLTQPIDVYNLEKSGEAHVVTALGAGVSLWWFLRTVRWHRTRQSHPSTVTA